MRGLTCCNGAVRRLFTAFCRASVLFCVNVLMARFNRAVLDGKQIPAFARGARPELSAGTVLSNVKLTMRQQDTVAFYVLESYEIVPQEDRAA